jgi:hypothetical protein
MKELNFFFYECFGKNYGGVSKYINDNNSTMIQEYHIIYNDF